MFQDLRYAIRLMCKAPGFTAVAALTLALGIGANTAIFSIVNAVLLRPLPYRDPARLTMITDRNVKEGGQAVFFPRYRDYEEYARRARLFESLSAASWAAGGTTLTGRGPAVDVVAIAVSEPFFDTLGVKAELGRTFLPADDNRGCSVVLARRFWIRKLASDRGIVGQTLDLNRKACTVVGVMPQGFSFYPPATDLWRLDRAAMPPVAIMVGRPKPGVTRLRAQAELESIYHGLHASDEFKNLAPTVGDLQAQFLFLAGRNLRTTLWVLLASVLLVLLIACVNVANLLLGRSLVRARELAIRAALGGGRTRLFRQLITEGLALAALGGAFGIAAAYAGVRYFLSVNPVELPVGAQVAINLPVLAFALAVSAATAVLFGVAPAWRGTSAALNARGVVGGGRSLVKLLIVAEMALSVVLLAGAGLLMGSVLRMGSAPMGFNPNRLYSTDLAAPKDPQFYDTLEARVAAVPGVESAALSSSLPPYDNGGGELDILGVDAKDRSGVTTKSVSASYFHTMELALLAGRTFDAHDASGSAPVALVNEALARTFFPRGDAIGRQIRTGKSDPYATIVGIVANEKETVVTQEMNWVDRPTVLRPLAQAPVARLSIAIRSASDAAPIGAAIRREVAAFDPNASVRDLESLRHKLVVFMAYPRFRAVLLGAFAAFALLLAAVGLHGVLGQLVAQRTQEIGVRMALGAKPADVARLIAGQGSVPVVAGLALGLGLALLLGRTVSSLLYGVRPHDPLTLAAVSAILLVVAAIASAIPARRAARIDPIEALRQE